MRTRQRKIREITPFERLARERKIEPFAELRERENWRLQQERVKAWRKLARARSRRAERRRNAAAVAFGIGIGCAVTGLAAAGALGWSRTASGMLAFASVWLVVSVFCYRRAA